MAATDDPTVPSGAITTALTMMEALSGREHGSRQEVTEVVTAGVQRWGTDTITQAFGLLIFVALQALNPASDDPEDDPLRTVVPAMVNRLRRMRLDEVPQSVLPTVAGILTAAALDQNAYQWRTSLGPIPTSEGLAWLYVAWLLADLHDSMTASPGGFGQLVATTLLEPENTEVASEP